MRKNEIHVKIGEIKIGHAGDVLKATLGSCVGIAFVWTERGVSGLAHCLLPDIDRIDEKIISAKYVRQAVPSLISLLKVQSTDLLHIKVYVAGGGNMMSQLLKNNIHRIGDQNIESAKKNLERYQLNYKIIDSGGECGRQMYVDCSSGEVSVKRIQRNENG